MEIRDISLPEIYLESSDFRFFREWFAQSLDRLKFQHENFMDNYDPLRCPEEFVWLLAQTMGYKFDDRLPTSFNRLVLLYFMSMIHNRGSRDGVMLAAQTNLAQFNILKRAKGYKDDITGRIYPKNDILYNRLEDTSIPVNSVYVSVETDKGYIDVVYFSDKKPLDACIEYVRPVGMYCFQHAGVRFDAKTKMAFMDVRLTNTRDCGMSFGPTHVGHYRRRDYASMQLTREKLDDTEPTFRIKRIPNTNAGKWFIQEEMTNSEGNPFWESIFGPFNAEKHAKAHFDSHINDRRHIRENVWYRNREGESGVFSPPVSTAPASFRYTVNGEEYIMNPGYRTMYSLQLSNNEQIVQSLFDEPVFSIGYGPQDFQIKNYADDYLRYPYRDKYADGSVEQPEAVIDPDGRRNWETNQPERRVVGRKAYNLRYNRDMEEAMMTKRSGYHDSVVRPYEDVSPNTEITSPEEQGGGNTYSIQYDPDPLYDEYAIDGSDGNWYLMKNGERLEPKKTYAERRIAEVRLAVMVPPDMYTVDIDRTDVIGPPIINPGEPMTDYEANRTKDVDNRTKARPVVNPIMATLGDSISMVPDIYGNFDGKGSIDSPKVTPTDDNTEYTQQDRNDELAPDNTGKIRKKPSDTV